MANKGNPKRTFGGRSMQSCLACRDCHVKCDEGRPICQNCIKVTRECVQTDGSPALPSSISSDATAANTPNTTPARPCETEFIVDNLSIITEDNNASETGKAASTIRNANSEPLSDYKESEIDSTDHDYDHDTNNHHTKQPRPKHQRA
ncbi:hypothetical protein KCU73_g8918, partial [Aureobasidium melanogenum]